MIADKVKEMVQAAWLPEVAFFFAWAILTYTAASPLNLYMRGEDFGGSAHGVRNEMRRSSIWGFNEEAISTHGQNAKRKRSAVIHRSASCHYIIVLSSQNHICLQYLLLL